MQKCPAWYPFICILTQFSVFFMIREENKNKKVYRYKLIYKKYDDAILYKKNDLYQNMK